MASFEALKNGLESTVVTTIDQEISLVVETDVSDVDISTILQNRRSVAFFSRTLSKSERHHYFVKKETNTIAEALRKWRYRLQGTSGLLRIKSPLLWTT